MLYPEARAALERAAGEPAVTDPAHDVAAERAAAREAARAEPREDVAAVADVDLGGVPCRRYEPVDAAPGVVVHVHGGGFVFNDVEVHDGVSRRLANRTGRTVVSVDYRLAPEHRFPAAVDDLDAVVGALTDAGEEALYAHGDSAGANLALVAALRHPGRFRALVLVYPFLDPEAAGESHRTETQGFDPATVAWYWRQYAGDDPAAVTHPDLAPLRSERLATLPPTFVATAEHDPLRDEGELLATRLVEAGVPVVAVRCLGQLHGFWRHLAFPAAEPLMAQTAAFLRAH
ncbi:hypothetical protein GCM10023340_38150 [Nocardioides marinquilinus]|uniref:Alpha/beta hydrolase fold-3 domain-containing protein n=1 Tax=Nocardioides marinquilinus TaxID=1210400 RepID=A0ABP9PZG2_9ACTN